MPQLGDPSTWRRLVLAMPCPSDASNGQLVDFLPWDPLMGPTIGLNLTLTLTLVNAQGQDGTQAPQS